MASLHSSIRTVSITSGKGGVGKTTLVSNIAVALQRKGQKVLILDGDWGMANINVFFGINPKKNLSHLISGQCQIQEILCEVSPGISIIPGGSGLVELQQLDAFQKLAILEQVGSLEGLYDYLLIDTAPGIGDNVLYLNSTVQEVCVVVTPDPASLTDSYALIKVLNREKGIQKFSVICNEVENQAQGERLFARLSDIVWQFLHVGLEHKGSIPYDSSLSNATRAQTLVVQSHPLTPAARSLSQIAETFEKSTIMNHACGGMQFFWEQIIGVA